MTNPILQMLKRRPTQVKSGSKVCLYQWLSECCPHTGSTLITRGGVGACWRCKVSAQTRRLALFLMSPPVDSDPAVI